MLALGQLQLEVTTAQQLLGDHLAAPAPEHRVWMADPEGFEPLQLAVEVAVNFAEGQQGFRLHRGTAAGLLQPGLGESIELGVQGRHLASAHGEASGRRMAAKALEQGSTVLERLVDRKPTRCPYRGPQAAIALSG